VATANREGTTCSEFANEKPANSGAMYMAAAWSRVKGNAGGNDVIGKGFIANFHV